jgi:hypothetical protein
MSNQVTIFGIRHHGCGSARSLVQSLQQLKPDAILIEGPPEADELIPLAAEVGMKPPVALLLYAPEDPQRSVYYPFAAFSPEWQAMQYGLGQGIPVRFMDLPQTHQLGSDESTSEPEAIVAGANPAGESEAENSEEIASDRLLQDPLQCLAEAAGYEDGERWWEQMVEHRRDNTELFAAILEAMTDLRSELGDIHHSSPTERLREQRREAYMRQTIREAQKQGFTKIAVVCGAWHAPALAAMPPAKPDSELLKGLPKIKVEASWIPWTYGRLSQSSGYGAGIESPGWYEHLWTVKKPQQITTRWLTRVAHLFRQQQMDASSASVIEAVRLAETLAAMRDRTVPGLAELNEAVQTVLCFGDTLPMQLIHERLIVNDRLGQVPTSPTIPLQQDLQRQQKRLRLKPEVDSRSIELDLRQPNDLARSQLLHRLNLLEIPWGKLARASGKGTFKEAWSLAWQPTFEVQLIERSRWGTTVETATSSYVCNLAATSNQLPRLTDLLDRTLLASLPAAIELLLDRLQAEAALAQDIAHLMAALPALANVLRYGNVRQIETSMVGSIVRGFVARICVGLPLACASLNDEAAAAMDKHIMETNRAVSLLEQPDLTQDWQNALRGLADRTSLHGLIAGRCCRLLLDAGLFSVDEIARRLSYALSTANEPAQAAGWIEGLLKGSGLLLLHQDALWQAIDEWLTGLPTDIFTEVLPLLRRTFSTFPAAERRQMGERLRQGKVRGQIPGLEVKSGDLDLDRAAAIVPLVAQLLGIS